MSSQAWLVFATFWLVFVTTPGPNAINCISNGIAYGFRRSLWGVLAILTQASLFLAISAAGISAVIASSPDLFFWLKISGSAVLIWLGLRGLFTAGRAVSTATVTAGSIYLRALLIATINAKSVAGYLAAFTQFIQSDLPIREQMVVIFPTALTLTVASYTSYTAIGVWLGRRAMAAVLNIWFRRFMGLCFVVYGVLLGLSGWNGSSI